MPPTTPPTIAPTLVFDVLMAAETGVGDTEDDGGDAGTLENAVRGIEEVEECELMVDTGDPRAVESGSSWLASSSAAVMLNAFGATTSMYAQAGMAVPLGIGLGKLYMT